MKPADSENRNGKFSKFNKKDYAEIIDLVSESYVNNIFYISNNHSFYICAVLKNSLLVFNFLKKCLTRLLSMKFFLDIFYDFLDEIQQTGENVLFIV